MANKGLDDFLGGEEPAPIEAVIEEATGTTPVIEAPAEPVKTEAEPKAEAAAPETPAVAEEPEPEDVKGLRSALVAERKQRQDYKGERDRLQGEIAAMKAQMEALSKAQQQAVQAPQAPVQQAAPVPIPPPPNPVEDPEGYAAWFENRQANVRANISERVLRAEVKNDAEINAKIALFREAAEANPNLGVMLRVHPEPYRYAYEMGKQIEQQRADQAKRDAMLKELGDTPDLAAYKEKIAAEVRAQLEAEYANAPMNARPAPVVLPQSLGTARSAAPRAMEPVSAPSFDEVFQRRSKRA